MYRNGMRRDRFRQGSWILETLNLVFSIITILLGIFILLNINTMKQWLAVLFLAGASVNLLNSMQSFYYGKREVVVNIGLAENLGLHVGDTLELRDSALGTMEATISAVADNYVYNYVYLSPETYAQQLGELPEYNTLYVLGREDADPYEEGAVLLDQEGVSNVTINQATRDQVENMLSRLDYVVVVVVICAGALAFIVLYNLTNINITERIREIATIKVLEIGRAHV